MLVHLDTDLGGDTDDACALALLLGQAGVEVAGITTVADRTGRRAGCARHCLRLAGRDGIPVIAGAGRSMTAQLRAADLPRLRAAGPLGELLARQGEAHGQDFQMTQLGRLHAGLRFRPGTAGRPMRVLTDLDPGSFTEYWLNAVEAAQSPA
jgi:Inosine-uridine preferring nucleoside hydrolase